MQATIVKDSAQRGVENVLTKRLTVRVSLQAFTNELQRIHQNLFRGVLYIREHDIIG